MKFIYLVKYCPSDEPAYLVAACITLELAKLEANRDGETTFTFVQRDAEQYPDYWESDTQLIAGAQTYYLIQRFRLIEE